MVATTARRPLSGLGGTLRSHGLVRAARSVGGTLLTVVPLLAGAAFLALALRHQFAYDFGGFWRAAHDVIDGRSPYPSAAAVAHASPDAPNTFYVYPPVVALAVAPLALLPFPVAAALDVVLLCGCLVLALRLLGVRDPRCYAVAFGSAPVLFALRLGTITPVLVLLLAIAWRYRDQAAVTGAAIGLAVAAKLFLWPLALWLLVTRRFRAGLTAAGVAAGMTAATWAAIGFRGLTGYPALLHAITGLEGPVAFAPAALAARLGVPHPAASWPLLVAAPLALLAAHCLRAREPGERDRRLFAAAVAASILLTPMLWLHYFALLVIPAALAAPGFGPAWLLLLAFWISPIEQPGQVAAWRIALALALTVAAGMQTRRPEAARVEQRTSGDGAWLGLLQGPSLPRPTLSRLPGGKP